jgi:endonuclease/exonuclease/phosphatase family metal-dependent hydrolase
VNQGELVIISANISRKNPLGKRALSSLLRKRPHILCLQEVLQQRLDILSSVDYHVGKTVDHQHTKDKTGYIATAVRNKESVISFNRIRYFDEHINSFWDKVAFQKISKLKEWHEALVLTFRHKGQLYRVVNVHLSMACGPKTRIAQLETVLKKCADGKTIFCGDFNIVNDMLFKIGAGWACGYRLQDYFFDERRAANDLFKRYGLRNLFAKKKTIKWPFRQQFDHILVPKDWHVLHRRMKRIPLSDHKALVAAIVPS